MIIIFFILIIHTNFAQQTIHRAWIRNFEEEQNHHLFSLSCLRIIVLLVVVVVISIMVFCFIRLRIFIFLPCSLFSLCRRRRCMMRVNILHVRKKWKHSQKYIKIKNLFTEGRAVLWLLLLCWVRLLNEKMKQTQKKHEILIIK